jgi:hypothetical protein
MPHDEAGQRLATHHARARRGSHIEPIVVGNGVGNGARTPPSSFQL